MTLTVTVLSGYPGVGKSFIANELSTMFNAIHLETDAIRKELTHGEPTYTGEESQRTYQELYRRAEQHLSENTSVILDATFNLQIGRDNAAQLAENANCTFHLINVTCNAQTTKTRIRNRTNTNSDADVNVYETIKQNFEPFTRPTITLDNSHSKQDTLDQLHNKLSPTHTTSNQG